MQLKYHSSLKQKKKINTATVQLEKLVQKGCRFSMCEDIKNLTAHSPEQPIVSDRDLHGDFGTISRSAS